MKKQIYISTLCLGLMLSVACSDQLELQPAQSISQDLALENEDNILAVLIGAYDALSTGDLYGGSILRNSELLGGDDEVQWVGTFSGPREIFNKAILVNNSDVEEMWLDSYTVINICNNILDALDKISEDEKGRVEGEALFIRSAAYFELVRFFSPQFEAGQAQSGVPIVLTPTRGVSEQSKQTRASLADCYNQIISDLVKAESLLPEENGVFASKFSSAALLSRVYLQQGNYAAARDAATRVIESNLYRLETNYSNAFNQDDNSDEDIFAIQVNNQDGVNDMNTFFSIPDFGGRDGDIDILDAHLALYDPADERLGLFFEGNGAVRSGKWNNQFGNISIIRLAEMYLTRAECNLRLGTSTGAAPLEDYNTVHTRAGLAAATTVDLAEVLLERRREFAHEGHKIHDAKRNQTSIGNLPYNSPKLVYPIPFREITANSLLTQNAGY